ncbi:MAG: PorP/SprF family type IX secretion system membrane protein [Bacteroidetes bacterium]|nr:PorP/SprF family type IX secretion system membrane protein [Bacteroidota bacterium]
MNSFGQDPQLSQFYSAPLNLNPALTGNTMQMRYISNYRKQWTSVPGAFNTYALSFDYNLVHKNSGAGIEFLRDKAGSGALRFRSIGGFYAYQVMVGHENFIRFGLKGAAVFRDVDYSRFIFGDQLLRNDGTGTTETINKKTVFYPDFGTGAVYLTQRWWLGVSFNHLNRPNQSLVGIKTRLPVNYSVHGGFTIPITKDDKNHDLSSLSVIANYKGQQQWDQIDFGMYYKRKPFKAGMWYRGIPYLKAYEPGYPNDDALVFYTGFFLEDYHLSIGYSYDLTISRLTARSGGSHEISLIYEYARPDYKKQKSKRVVPCPKFVNEW